MLVLSILMMSPLASKAEVKHTLFRRVAVFPIHGANVTSGEEAWWQMREILTKDQRFFVASRRFMINRGVFQPRQSLKPADVIILSRILDAQALVTMFLQERTLQMKVYEGENGYLLWEGKAEFHPAIPINDQLIRMSSQLMNAFLLSIPYQGFQVIDKVIAKPVYEENGKYFAQVSIGVNHRVQVGDSAQWVEVTGAVGEAFFGATTRMTILAEGRVTAIKGDQATVVIEKLRDLSDLQENSLVRFPTEVNRLANLYAETDRSSSLAPEYLSTEIKSADEIHRGHSKTSSSLMWIASVLGFVLLAF